MLTPQEITEKVFVKAVFGGYDMTGVDDFLEALSTDYASLYKENAILKSKLKVLVEKVEEYRSTEDTMRMTLLTAQRMGEEITIEANKKKDEMIRGAEAEAQARIAETARLIADEEFRLSVAAKETAKFIELSQAIIHKHSEFLTKLETARRAVVPEPVPPPPPPPSFEETIADTAEQIGNAVERLTDTGAYAPDDEPVPDYEDEPDSPPLSLFEDEGEPTKAFNTKGTDDSVSPRPKFDFDDLKFGSNFDKKK